MISKEVSDLKSSAKAYVHDLYLNHRKDDIEAWYNLIDILFLYVDEQIKIHHSEFKDE